MSLIMQLLSLLKSFDPALMKALVPLLTKLNTLIKTKAGFVEYIGVILEILALFSPTPPPTPTPPGPGPIPVFGATSEESSFVAGLKASGIDETEAQALANSLK